MTPSGATNDAFLAGLKRRALAEVIRFPGIPIASLAKRLTPALTPRCATEVVDAMIDAGELHARETRREPGSDGPPLHLLSDEERASVVRDAAMAAPTRHCFAPIDPARWPK